MFRFWFHYAVVGSLILVSSMGFCGEAEQKKIPGPFHPYNLNGKNKDSYHCLVCEYGLRPVAMVFAREPSKNPEQLPHLLEKLDGMVKKDFDTSFKTFSVLLSPDALNSVDEAGVVDSNRTTKVDELINQAIKHKELLESLKPKAAKFENLILSVYPGNGPKIYNLPEKADVVVILYEKHVIFRKYMFGPGELTPERIEAIINDVYTLLGRKKDLGIKN